MNLGLYACSIFREFADTIFNADSGNHGLRPTWYDSDQGFFTPVLSGNISTLIIRVVEDQRHSYNPKLVSVNENDQTSASQYQIADGVMRAYAVTHPLAMSFEDQGTRIYGQFINVTQRDLTDASTFERLLRLSPRAVVRNALTQKVGDFFRRLFLAIVREANPLAYETGAPPASK